MSCGWKDSRNAQFGRPRRPLPPPSPPPLFQLTVEKLRENSSSSIWKHEPNPFENREIIWENLPEGSDPQFGHLENTRLQNKRRQIENVMCPLTYIVKKVASKKPQNTLHIVEFCASSGFVGIPFSATTSHPTFTTILDAKVSSISIAWSRIAAMKGIEALVGRTEDYMEDFDVGIAVHACGEATDVVIDKSLSKRAAFVVVPCCVGRLSRFARGYADMEKGEDEEHSLDQSDARQSRFVKWNESVNMQEAERVESAWKEDVTKTRLSNYDGRPRPRSKELARLLGNGDPSKAARVFAALAKAADASFWCHNDHDDNGDEEERKDEVDDNVILSKLRKDAKRIVDWDRLEMAREQGYVTGSFTMIPSSCTPKNDVLYAYPKEWDFNT